MRRLTTELTKWYESQRFGAAVFLSSLLLAALLLIDGALGFEPAFRILYVLPLWFATRLGGRSAGFVLVLLGTVVGTSIDTRHADFDYVTLVSSGFLHFLALGLIMLAISRMEEALWRARKLAMHDPLTGLLNRRALKDFGGEVFVQAKELNRPLTAVMIDCDDFKKLNDAFGHSAGDHALQILARVLESETREMDLIARVGGDEFIILLPGSDEAEARGVMARVQKLFEARILDAGYSTSLSVGMASIQDDDRLIDSLLDRADSNMYSEKAANKKKAYLN